MERDDLQTRATWLLVALAAVLVESAMWRGTDAPLAHAAILTATAILAMALGRRVCRDALPPRDGQECPSHRASHDMSHRVPHNTQRAAHGASRPRRQPTSGEHRLLPVSALALLVTLIAAPWMIDGALRALAQLGEPNEVLLVRALRDLSIGLASLSAIGACRHLACVASLFLVLFGLLLSAGVVTIALVIVYVVVGVWWLIGAYWDRLQGHFLPSDSRREVPKLAVGATLALVALGAAGVSWAAHGSAAPAILAELFPSSGGTGQQDAYARQGVGDGQQLTGAQHDADAFGAVETDLFLDSDTPSMYDMFNDMYGEPVPKKSERAIPLAANVTPRDAHQMAAGQRGGRDFNTARRSKNHAKAALQEDSTPAVMQVVGRVPLHLRLEIYNTWDGAHLGFAPVDEARTKLTKTSDADGRGWVQCGRAGAPPAWARRDEHLLRILNLETNCVPSPPNMTQMHLDKLDRADFFVWREDGQLRLDREQFAPLTVMRVRSQRARQAQLGELRFLRTGAAPRVDVALARLARAWTTGLAEGWPQVEAVCERLRSGYQLDRAALPPTDAPDAAVHFLTSARRGPDYLFATSAALVLRELGYSTRVASGFYAATENFDRAARHTVVTSSDVHFWTEIELADGAWLPLEPTPGYRAPYEPWTWAEWMSAAAAAGAEWLWRQRWSALAVAVAALAAWRWRVALTGAALDGVWWVATRANRRQAASSEATRRLALWTMWLVEWRGWLAQQPRAKSMPFDVWHTRRAASLGRELGRHAGSFRAVVDWALYGGACRCPIEAVEARAACAAMTRFARMRDSSRTE